jgi:adenylosuccinate lyase
MEKTVKDINAAVGVLCFAGSEKGRNLQMPGDGRYQPEKLKFFLGYDQWAGWLIIVEWFWLITLAEIGVMPSKDSRLLTVNTLNKLLLEITTTIQDSKEKETKHDILALLILIREYLPKELHRWLHFCATSYDIINTAYSLQIKAVFENVFIPEISHLDELWRSKIEENALVIQAGRTHLQTALPLTVGFWLANLHNRFVNTARKARMLAKEISGKFSGAVGTSASQRVLIDSQEAEKILMKMLGLPAAEVSTQITPPESMARFYHELVLLSGSLANLGEDTRILQSSQFGEIISESSSSSAMSHKKANPIAAENISGMHTTVVAEFMKVSMTLVSNLQRDLRWSNVMRSYSAVAVYVFQQILTAKRLLKSMKIDKKKCRENFEASGNLVVAELLHLWLQRAGLPEAHQFVNKEIIPIAAESGNNLYEVMRSYVSDYSKIPENIWNELKDSNIISYLTSPDKYIGDAIVIAEKEAKNKL